MRKRKKKKKKKHFEESHLPLQERNPRIHVYIYILMFVSALWVIHRAKFTKVKRKFFFFLWITFLRPRYVWLLIESLFFYRWTKLFLLLRDTGKGDGRRKRSGREKRRRRREELKEEEKEECEESKWRVNRGRRRRK